MNRRAAAVIAVLASASLGAVQMTLDRRAIEEAVFVGQSRLDAERNQLHSVYRVSVARAPVDWIDVITPFHRVVLAAERSARAGSRQFGQREAAQILGEAPDQIDLLVEMTFHPLNTFVGVPPYTVVLIGPAGARVPPRRLDRIPRSGPRLDPAWPRLPAPTAAEVFGGGEPVVGGTLVAAFEGATLDATGRYEAVVLDENRELARTVLDLARMR